MAVLKILRMAYPAFYSRQRDDDIRETISLWADIFAEDDGQIVLAAVRELIQTHTGFPPEIADVRAKIKELTYAATGEPTDEELWHILRRALSDGIYNADRQFEAFPPVLKTYVLEPSQLREMAQMDTDVIDSVVHGQFLKQIPSIRKAQEYRDSLPPQLREAITRIYKSLDNGEYKPLNEPYFNKSRNNVLAALEG